MHFAHISTTSDVIRNKTFINITHTHTHILSLHDPQIRFANKRTYIYFVDVRYHFISVVEYTINNDSRIT